MNEPRGYQATPSEGEPGPPPSGGSNVTPPPDGGPVHPTPFIYMTNSMADKPQLRKMAQEFAERVGHMPRGITIRDWLVGQAVRGSAEVHIRPEYKAEYVERVVDNAEAIADEYLRRREGRSPPESGGGE